MGPAARSSLHPSIISSKNVISMPEALRNATNTDAEEDPPTTLPAAQRSIVLVGLMGAGKSSIGRRLAQRLNLPFVDADTEIEKAAGCSISDIFKLYGEAEFRRGERQVIHRLLSGPRQVIATGGGAFMDAETRADIRANGLSIWLKADLDTLVKRTRRRRHAGRCWRNAIRARCWRN